MLTAVDGVGAPGTAVLSAIAANARFLPMAVSLSPWLGGRGSLAGTAVHRGDALGGRHPGAAGGAGERRVGWFLSFAAGCWVVAAASTLLGFWLAPSPPGWLLALLLFTNPLYFGLVLAAFVVLAVVAPAGTMAAIPWPARLAGAGAAPGVLLMPGEDRILAALLAGLGATLAAWAVLG